MNLPELFLQRIRKRQGMDFPAFLRVYEQKPWRGLRVNSLKIAKEEFEKISPFAMTPVPWEQNGYYTEEEKIGAHPYHFAGLYYSQEPSAMSAVPLLQIKKGEKALDLCAAPGGKSGQIASALQGEGLLVSNEYVPSRSKILLENLERLGVKNAVVLNEDASSLAKQFPSYFDKILVDAPCSGEGMFRKDEGAILEWSEENVSHCALRQREILSHAQAMLKVGGLLVYSTCTFSEEEDEGTVGWFLQEYPDFELLEQKLLLPHEVHGEGHFVALLRKKEGSFEQKKAFSAHTDKKAEAAFSQFAKEFFAEGYRLKGEISTLPDGRMFLLPPEMPSLSCRILRAGLEIGEWNGKIFKPAHALACSLKKEECRRFVSLNLTQAELYLRGETVQSDLENGWCVVSVDGYSLGLGKIVNGVVKNHYPKGLRKRGATSYI